MNYNLDTNLTNLPESIIDKLEYLEETGVLQYYIANLILSNEYNEKDNSPRVKNSRGIVEKQRNTSSREIEINLTSKEEIEDYELVKVPRSDNTGIITGITDDVTDVHEYDEASLKFLRNMSGI